MYGEFKVMAATHIIIHEEDATLCGDDCPHLDVSGRVDQVELEEDFKAYDLCTLFTNKKMKPKRLNHTTGNRTPDGDWRWPKRCASCKSLKTYIPAEVEARVIDDTDPDEFNYPSEQIYDEDLKKFKMTADINFQAVDLDHAYEKLAEHFDNLGDNAHSDLITGGGISIDPVKD